jgi:hypothetical protein
VPACFLLGLLPRSCFSSRIPAGIRPWRFAKAIVSRKVSKGRVVLIGTFTYLFVSSSATSLCACRRRRAAIRRVAGGVGRVGEALLPSHVLKVHRQLDHPPKMRPGADSQNDSQRRWLTMDSGGRLRIHQPHNRTVAHANGRRRLPTPRSSKPSADVHGSPAKFTFVRRRSLSLQVTASDSQAA